VSQRLNTYTKNQSLSNNKTINILYRLFIDDPTVVHWIDSAINTHSGYAFDPSDQLTIIDFVLKDQFGRDLYIPSGPPGTNSGFMWDLNMVTEI
jgi:hypothetical protein